MARQTFGPPEVLSLAELEDPQAGPGEARVRIKAASVMPFVCGIRRGWAPELQPRLPIVLGNEFAGVIDQVGEGVSGFACGGEVMGYAMLGGYAELAAAGGFGTIAVQLAKSWGAMKRTSSPA